MLIPTRDQLAARSPIWLFYDASCGPCRFFARVAQFVSRSQLRALPLDSEEAHRQLKDLDEEARFAYAHLVDSRGRSTGAAIMAPLLGLTVGSAGKQVVVRVPPLGRGLRWIYLRFWNYRRTHGCAAPP